MHNQAQIRSDLLVRQAARQASLIASDELSGQERMLVSMYRALTAADRAALFRVLHPMVIHSISN
jgi:hypothetical protein